MPVNSALLSITGELPSPAADARISASQLLLPSAYMRNLLNALTPSGVASVTLSVSGSIDENTFISQRERVTATFSLRHPPSLFSGPKFIDCLPSLSGPYPTENSITSRSSPWTFSRFLMKIGSSPPNAHFSNSGSFLHSSSILSSIRLCCWMLNVTMP